MTVHLESSQSIHPFSSYSDPTSRANATNQSNKETLLLELQQLKKELDKALEGLPTQSGTKGPKEPSSTQYFQFDDSIRFSDSNAIAALGEAINDLLSIQPQLIAGEMAISTELVSPQVQKWSNAFLSILKYWETTISGLGSSPNSGQLATDQAAMSVANSASSSSSTALNGVMSMLSSGTSSKTTTYQNLVQQASSVVTALLNAMTQDWS